MVSPLPCMLSSPLSLPRLPIHPSRLLTIKLLFSLGQTLTQGHHEPAPFPPEPCRASHLRLHLQAGARTVSLEMRLCLYCPHRCGQFPPEPPAGPGGSHRHGLPQSAVQLGLAPDNLSCPKALLDFAEAEVIQLGLSWLQQAALSLVWEPGYSPASLPFWCPQVPCRPLRSGAGPLLGHLHTEKGFSLQKLGRAFLTHLYIGTRSLGPL